jgi:ATP-binding cassette, subfamily B, bacterial PglK
MRYIKNIQSLLDKKNRRSLLWLVLFSVLLSAIEVIGISAIMPFIDIATDFNNIHTNQYYQKVFDVFFFETEVNFAITFGLVLVVFYILRGIINLLYNYIRVRFTQKLYAQISSRLFKTYLLMPYKVFTSKNSSYLTKSINTEVSLVTTVISSVLLIISEALIVIFLYILMIIVNWEITLIFTIILIIKLLFITQIVTNKIKSAGSIRAKIEREFYEIMNRTFGNFKHIKLLGKSKIIDINKDFSVSVDQLARVNITHSFLTTLPRIFLETSGFSLVILLLVTLLFIGQTNVAYILPTLSLFVLALYRLLPSVNRILTGYNSIVFYKKSIDIIYKELKTDQENLKNDTIKFNRAIELKNVKFSYDKKIILDNINLTINKGDKVAFIGESGAGKSTLIDLIIGLHQPDQGEVVIDNVIVNENNIQNWRSQIGYIPQQVYLFDGTILDNICVGQKLDKSLLEQVLKKANIFDFLETKQGVKTMVGEGGIQLSGGQKQRIAIARALYGKPSILVLDEATSALDSKTEESIMNEIYQASRDKTLIIIAHRLSTIEGCNKIFEINNGSIDSPKI